MAINHWNIKGSSIISDSLEQRGERKPIHILSSVYFPSSCRLKHRARVSHLSGFAAMPAARCSAHPVKLPRWDVVFISMIWQSIGVSGKLNKGAFSFL